MNKHLKSPLTKLVMLFLKFALDSICKFNAIFQSCLPILPALKKEVNRLLRILLGRFIKADAIQGVEGNLSIIDLSDKTLHLSDDEMGVGHEAWAYISEEEDFIDSSVRNIFFSGVRDFYTAVASTILKNSPFMILW